MVDDVVTLASGSGNERQSSHDGNQAVGYGNLDDQAAVQQKLGQPVLDGLDKASQNPDTVERHDCTGTPWDPGGIEIRHLELVWTGEELEVVHDAATTSVVSALSISGHSSDDLHAAPCKDPDLRLL